MWWRFKRHKVAVASLWVLVLFYVVVVIAEVVAPYDAQTRDPLHIHAPPQPIHLFHEGRFVGPFTYGIR
ncbi:MAG: hypothetical protein R3C69_13825 [Geminicoccaceae bacterium]